jgi:lipid-binding SYLF domain-containing protein
MMLQGAMLVALGLGLAGCGGAPAPGEEQGLVDRATLSVQEILGEGHDAVNASSLLRRARAAMICPRVFRGGFFFGGQGGACVLLARDGGGSWSSPAFYGLGGGSFGLQAGIQDMEILILIMNDRALTAVLDNQFKFGGDASIAVATVGGSLEGATTGAVGADIVAVARARGLYAGLTLSGSLLSARSEWNRGYYRRDVGSRDILLGAAVHNPGADPLRAVLLRYGSAQANFAPPPPAYDAPPARPYAPPGAGYAPPAGPYAPPPPRDRIDAAPLPPVR